MVALKPPSVFYFSDMNESTLVKRCYYLDNLKVLLTFLVIAHHAAMPFVEGENWAYQTSNTAEYMPFMWHFLSTNASFFMGLFFLISGYFVPKSFDRQGFWQFIGKKVLRLIVPVAAVTILLTSLGGQLEAGHTWFLESLFLFCLCYALIRLAAKNKTVKEFNISIITLLLTTVLMSVGSYFIRSVSPQNNWIVWGAFKFEPAHYLQYIIMFALGALAGRCNSFEKITQKNGLAALIIGLALCAGNYLRAGGAWDGFVWHWFGIYESFLCVFLCIGLVWLFGKFCNWNNGFWKWCSAQAFGAYVVHLPLLLIIEFALDKVWVGAFGKFALVTVLAIAVSFGLTWLLRLIPGVKKVL